ncbi:uncharacterized protein P884DRAFT_253866, partial [Thermothelomyces heterothallicus CBS 202.75]|uniref:uncharacterized protein n=1 Tax=Thermothelomyces heterothallicus CBS 202.75 TaxID=1149848 RepID=UPI003743A12D
MGEVVVVVVVVAAAGIGTMTETGIGMVGIAIGAGGAAGAGRPARRRGVRRDRAAGSGGDITAIRGRGRRALLSGEGPTEHRFVQEVRPDLGTWGGGVKRGDCTTHDTIVIRL